jgi:hypothetical protein
MAITSIADIIVPEIWVPYMQERTAVKSRLIQSGIVETDYKYDSLVGNGSSTVNMPFFQDLTGRSQPLSESTPLDPKKITASQDVAVIHRRGDAWSSQDLAKALSGADPSRAIADLVADYWVRDMQTSLIYTLTGVFASTTMAAEHVLDVSIEDGNNAAATNLISSDSAISTFALLGDELGAFTGMAMHSDVYWELVRQDVIDFEPTSEQAPMIPSYKGKTVIVDNTLPKVAGSTSGFKYTTYLFGPGCFAFGEGTPLGEFGGDISVEVDRDILAGVGFLTSRRHFILHPKGVRWIGTISGDTPSDAEMQAAASYARVFEQRNVALAALITNG